MRRLDYDALSMKLQFLGSGNAFAPGGRCWSCFLVDGAYLFDCGPQALASLKKLDVDLGGIEAVFLTHFHADHWLGFPFLFLEYDDLTRRTTPLHIVGPPGVEEIVEDIYERVYFKRRRRVTFQRIYTPVHAGDEGQAAGAAFLALPMNHSKEKLRAFGYRVQIGDRVVSYTGDSAWCDEVVQLGQGADVFVIDSTHPDKGDDRIHMGFADARRLRELMAPDTTLILTHLQQAPTQALPNTIVAEDYATYEL
jgi:ribonuclease BN (tRNA processing enzyme)